MSDTPDDPLDGLDPDNLPPGYSLMAIGAAEIEYLKSYWELRDAGPLFGWALRLLHDLTKADEDGWCLVLQKGRLDEKEMIPDPAYKVAAFRLEWLMPRSDGYMRLPIDRLNETMRCKSDEGGGI